MFAILYNTTRYYYCATHLYHLWCSQVQVGTSSCTVRCQAAGRARTATPSLGPCCSSTQIWSHCSCWWMTAGTSSAEPLCNSSPFGCLKERMTDRHEVKTEDALLLKQHAILQPNFKQEHKHNFSYDVFAPTA